MCVYYYNYKYTPLRRKLYRVDFLSYLNQLARNEGLRASTVVFFSARVYSCRGQICTGDIAENVLKKCSKKYYIGSAVSEYRANAFIAYRQSVTDCKAIATVL